MDSKTEMISISPYVHYPQHNTPFHSEGICTLTQWSGLCVHMFVRSVLAVGCATGRASNARQVKGDDPDEKGVGHEATYLTP
jgi:hypothetical protein